MRNIGTAIAPPLMFGCIVAVAPLAGAAFLGSRG
jgi:hypothetical protein